jgi:hypothetical protein
MSNPPPPVAVIRDHRSPVTCTSFITPQGTNGPSLLVSGATDGEVRITDVTTRRAVAVCRPHGHQHILSAAAVDKFIVSQVRHSHALFFAFNIILFVLCFALLNTRVCGQDRLGVVRVWDVEQLQINPTGDKINDVCCFGSHPYSFCKVASSAARGWLVGLVKLKFSKIFSSFFAEVQQRL